MAYNLESPKAVLVAIKKIGEKKAAWNMAVHHVAVQCIGHAVQHGDVTLGWNLVKAVGGREAQAVINYFEEFGPFRLAKDDDGNSVGFKLNKKKLDAMMFDGERLLDGIKWFEFTPEPTKHKSKFDLDAKIAALIKKAEELAKEPGDVEVVNLDSLTDLRTLAQNIAAKKGKVLKAA